MNKVVINDCYGGYGLSTKATVELLKKKFPERKLYFYTEDFNFAIPFMDRVIYKITEEQALSKSRYDVMICTIDCGDELTRNDAIYEKLNDNLIYEDIFDRHDPDLVQVVEELGKEANGEHAKLLIQEIDSDLYRIDVYDGWETLITPEMDKLSYIKI